jgi:hypothetical protein
MDYIRNRFNRFKPPHSILVRCILISSYLHIGRFCTWHLRFRFSDEKISTFVRVIKFKSTKLEEHVARTGEIRIAYKISAGKPEKKKTFRGILTRSSEMD